MFFIYFPLNESAVFLIPRPLLPLLIPNVGSKGYIQRRDGERKRKSVRGCIVDNQLSVLNLAIVKKGEGEIEGITDTQAPRRRGPKRASKIRKLFNLTKKDGALTGAAGRKLKDKWGNNNEK